MIIDDSTEYDKHSPNGVMKGYVERDYTTHPIEMFAPPTEIPLIPRHEWEAIIKQQEDEQSSLEHIWNRKGLVNLDQNGQGFCWTYSVGHTIMMARARDNQESIRLSPHGVACKLKNFQDEGGWCGLSAEFARTKGYPTVEKWKEQSMSHQYDTEATWNDAKRFRITEDYVDLTRPVWGQNLTFDQVLACVLRNIPCAVDFNWWGHSVCAVRAVIVERGVIGLRIINSWLNWGEKGFATLVGKKAIPDGAIATRQVFTT